MLYKSIVSLCTNFDPLYAWSPSVILVVIIIILSVASTLCLSQPSWLLLAPWVFISAIVFIAECSIIVGILVGIATVLIVRLNLVIGVVCGVVVLS
jgi:hypothetical protein